MFAVAEADVLSHVLSGQRLPLSAHMNAQLFALCKSCWQDPSRRPVSVECCDIFHCILMRFLSLQSFDVLSAQLERIDPIAQTGSSDDILW